MWDNLKAGIASVVRTNNNQEITGENLQNVLNTIVNTVGANATFAGIAVPSTNPGTPDGPVFYIACESGIYSNFGNISLPNGISLLMWNGSTWSLQILLNGVVPSDLAPTYGSLGYVISDWLYQELYDVKYDENETSVVDIDNATRVTAWMDADGKWSVSSVKSSIVVPTGTYGKISITSNSSYNTIMLFCKTIPTPSKGASYSSVLCAGETGRRVQTNNTTEIYTLPSDCVCVVVGISATNNNEYYRPSNITLIGGEPISHTDRLNRIEDTLFYHPLSSFVTIDLDSAEKKTAWMGSNGNWSTTSGQSTALIPVGNYRHLRVTSNESYSTFMLFCKTKPSPSNNTSYSSVLCARESGRRELAANTTQTYNLPSDCVYVAIGITSASAAPNRYKPSLVEMARDSNDLLPIIPIIQEKVDRLREIKILSIGNSLSRDMLSYVPMIMKELGVNVTIGILYHSSCSLQMHWENKSSSTYYTFDYFSWLNGSWQQTSSVGIDYGLAYDDWDIVTLQQNSSNSFDYTTFQPYLNNLVEYISTKVHNVKIGWMLTHAWAPGYSGLTSRNMTSDEMAEAIGVASKRVMDETASNVLFPCGTAVQIARQDATFQSIGTAGYLSYDGVHLQEGIGCQIAAYVSSIILSNIIIGKRSINGNEIIIDSSFLSTYNIPEQHGSAAGSTTQNCLTCQRYASVAVKKQYFTQDNL